jgi:glycosyltransferase involved in cell wall biosynthesis
MTAGISVVIITRNEERHLERAIRSVEGLASEVVVVDSYSSDRTVELARSMGARVHERRFINHADQLQWALDNTGLTGPWTMRLDADEYLTPELKAEIAAKLPTLPPEVTAVVLKRRHIFLGRFIKHGGRYPLRLLRIWRQGAARIEQRWMDEHPVLLRGAAVTFEHDFCDHNLGSVTSFIEKHNGYATREAIEILNQRYGFMRRDLGLAEGRKGSASIKRMIKDKAYNHLPFGIGPFIYFVYRYFIQFGFLDGKEGFAYHFLQGFWYRVLVSVKALEFERAIHGLKSAAEMTRVLSAVSGLDLTSAARDELNPPNAGAARTLPVR